VAEREASSEEDGPGDEPDEQPTVDARIHGTVQLRRGADIRTAGLPRVPEVPAVLAETRYAPTAEIARGGMGRVVEAIDTLLGRTVAVKEALSLDPDALKRFTRETRITARLEHPSIVPVHDAGVSPTGQPFYVMRKVGGRPLEELVARASDINRRLALLPHVGAAAHAIAHAHSRGIVHRDIKPSNILVGDLGETIVIDWGLAKAIEERDDDPHTPAGRVIDPAPGKSGALRTGDDDTINTRAGIVFGTPGFMAPEQLRGKPVDERCDVYALGATLYYLLARQPPHHTNSGADMMTAAIAGPPTPLAELVDGVPPELATIVDKALAHDPRHRYHDAGALAEDLQRFLTGQLVASHYYTPREKLTRFLAKHKTSAAIAAGAALALVLLAGFFVQEIREERDRADEQAIRAVHEQRIAEQQREEVIEKSRELVLTNARHLATTDPTRAVAMVKPLVDSMQWRAARDVGAAASVHGVAFSLAASPQTLTLELSRDGERALAAGDDGVVRIYELGKREGRIVADGKGAMMARFGDGERKILLFQGNRLTILDTATGDMRDVTAPTAIAQLEISGPIAYWVDPAAAVWKLDLAGGVPTRLDVQEPVTAVAPSPDGRWIALAGRDHLLLVDRASATLPPEIVTQGRTKTMTWSADAAHLVALIDDQVIDVSLAPSPRIWRRITVGTRFSAAYSGGRIYSAGPTGVGVVEPQGTKLRSAGPEHTLGVHEARGRVAIAAKPQGEILVLADHGDRTLRCPVPISLVATSARGPWIVAAAEGQLLVWSLDAIEPRAISERSPSSARFVTADHVILTYFDEPAQWIDLRKHTARPLGVLGAIESVATAPDGGEAIVIDGARRAWRVAGVGLPQRIDGEISAAVFVDEHRLVIAGARGLRLEDTRQRTKLALYAHDRAAKTLAATAADGGWIAAAFEDGRLWRKQLRTNTDGELELGIELSGAMPLAVADDGTVLFAAGGELRAWRADGRIDVLGAPLPAVTSTALVDRVRLLGLADNGTYLAEVVRAAPLAPPIALLGKQAALSRTGGLVAAATVTGGVEVVDPVVDWRWSLAQPQQGQAPFTSVDIAPDGSRVLASNATEVFVWTLALPADAAATKTWLEQMTNATIDKPTGPLGWD
jgi:serine/threonine protein kinase